VVACAYSSDAVRVAPLQSRAPRVAQRRDGGGLGRVGRGRSRECGHESDGGDGHKGGEPVIELSLKAQAPCYHPSRSQRRVLAGLFLLVALVASGSASAPAQPTYRIDHVSDGDTVVLRNGQRVRLVQIDTPEVFFGTECYGRQASATTKGLLSPGTRVRLLPEPATDRIDEFGRLLR
jgi:hypothetical protein